MKFTTLTSILLTTAVSVYAQITAPTRNYNVTSPVTNGPYVIGQILPCTYRLFSDVDSSALNLQIDLEALPVGNTISSSSSSNGNNSTTISITASADVSKTDAFVKREGNLTYYEHSINFNIPSTVKPGNYHVIFLDKSTSTKLAIPIEIRPAAVPTSTGLKSQSTNAPGQSSTPGSIFAQGAAASTVKTTFVSTKVVLALFTVAGVAFLL
ncbi:hypothetical protein BDF20DRAFT_904511 [Mycotypha africana]|uniref:uncharacterized protein n=1 Tax=Mycotypha africana TaxID=64632 RepID=UPI002301A4A5|nr:uncharacterized protein BDF20DRAFT_904511 [Mycotypha africana]KAI8987362.1 hypothetical protein BDF20DRAFT_904511 [Mycotypha africana]